eukprot:gene28609-35495_t
MGVVTTVLQHLLFAVWFLVVKGSFVGDLFETGIKVTNQYPKDVSVKISGLGFGGCDLSLNADSSTYSNDCWCLWGTLNYNFCVYANKPSNNKYNEDKATNITNLLPPQTGKKDISKLLFGCPPINAAGELLLCFDEKSLGNCYNKAYQCEVTAKGKCDCK